jgi:hypothetical protein
VPCLSEAISVPFFMYDLSHECSHWYLQPCRSIVLPLYPVDQFYCLEKPEYSEKTIVLLQFTETNVSWKVVSSKYSRRLNLLYYKDILCLPLGNTCYKGLRMCPACRKQYPFHSLFMTYHTSAWVKVFNDTFCIVHPALTYNFCLPHWYLQPFRSIVFLLYSVDQFYCLEKPE